MAFRGKAKMLKLIVHKLWSNFEPESLTTFLWSTLLRTLLRTNRLWSWDFWKCHLWRVLSAGRGLLFCFAPWDGSHNHVNFYVHERGFLPWSHPTQRLKVQKIVLVGQGQAFGVPKSNRTFTALHIKIRYRAPFFSGHILRKISTFFGECIALFEVLFGSIGYSVRATTVAFSQKNTKNTNK